MKVTMYVPNYNSNPYIKECLDSIEALSYPDMEVLINDDGSTDGSLEVCEEYAKQDDRITLFKRASATGICGDINDTLSHATGEIVCKVDSDDMIYDKNFWDIVLPYFSSDKIGFVRIGLIILKGSDTGVVPAVKWDWDLEIFQSNKVYGSSPFRLKMFKDVGGWDIGRVHPDWDFWIRCVLKGWKWATCPTPTYFYRRHKAAVIINLTSEKQEKALQYYREKYRKDLERFGMKVAQPNSGMIGEW